MFFLHNLKFFKKIILLLVIILVFQPTGLPAPSKFSFASQFREKLKTEQLSPTEFSAFLEKRIKSGNFNCSDLGALDNAVCHIFQSALGMNTQETIHNDFFQTLFAIETMNYVQNRLPASRYSLISRNDNFIAPSTDAAHLINLGYGICGHHTATFLALVERIGIKARPVQFFYETKGQRNSHIAVEVDINGWRYFDPTWSTFWYKNKSAPFTSIASLHEILNSNRKLFSSSNASNPWYIQQDNPFDYLDQNPSVVYGYNEGIIKIKNSITKNGVFNFASIPRYIGDNQTDQFFKGISYEFPEIAGASNFNFIILSMEGCSSGNSKLCVNDFCSLIDAKQLNICPIIDIQSYDAKKIYISSDDDVCYVTFKNILITKPKIANHKR